MRRGGRIPANTAPAAAFTFDVTVRSATTAAIAVLVLAVVVWQVAALLGGGSPSDPEDPALTAAQMSAEPAVEPGASELEPDRRNVITAAAGEREIDRDRDLHGCVVDATGVAVPGARIEVFRSDAHEYHFLDVAHNRRRHRVYEGETDAAGEFAVPLPLGRPFTLEVVASGLARWCSRAVYAGQYVEVVMHGGATVFGRVTRVGDGTPVANATVVGRWPRVLENDLRRPQVLRGTTDTAGRYRFDGLSAGQIQLRVIAATEASPRWADVELVAGEEREHDVVLESGVEIRGRVIDAATRQPIAGAEIGEGWTFAKSVVTDSDGRYVYRGFPDSHRDLEVRAPGYGRSERAVRDKITRRVAPTVDFELHAARQARGRVIDASGKPLPGAYVAATASDYEGPDRSQRIDWASSVTAADGTFEIADMRPDMRHFLLVASAGHGTVVFDFPPSETHGPVVDLGVIQLERQALIRGVVVDQGGEPVAAHPVILRGSNADRDRLAGSQRVRRWNIDGYIAERSATTDDLGRFAFADVAGGTYTAYVMVEGAHTPVTTEVTVSAGQVVGGVRLVLPRGLGLQGRVVLSDNGPMPKVYISVEPQDGQEAMARGEVRVNGDFAVRGLLPGRYLVTAYPYQTPADKVKGRRFAPRRIAGIQAGRSDVVLELTRAAVTTGRVVDPQGLPVAAAFVTAVDAAGLHVDGTTANDHGAFELLLAEGTHVTLQVNRPRDKGAPESPRVSVQGVAAGSRDVIVQMPN